MTTRPRFAIMIIIASSMLAFRLIAQGAPQTPTRVWRPKSLQSLQREALVPPDSETLDPGHTYTLAELIDLAEEHNPETRVAWQEAKSKAASLGIARGALYPTISAVAIGASLRTGT